MEGRSPASLSWSTIINYYLPQLTITCHKRGTRLCAILYPARPRDLADGRLAIRYRGVELDYIDIA
jgi:hypothetical protein